jgi:hypothetical protein
LRRADVRRTLASAERVAHAKQSAVALAAVLSGGTLERAMAEALYALEKLADAVAALATGSGRVRDRLFEASTYLIRVRPEDIPDEDLRRTFIGVMDDDLSYAQPLGDEGRILATLRLTNDDDARAIARRILDLHRELDRLLR